MPEGLLDQTSGTVAGGVYDDPDHEPAADPAAAPHGWTWNRKARRWDPRQRARKGTGSRGSTVPPPAGPAAAGPPPGDGPAQQLRDPDPGWLREDSGGGDASRGRLRDVPEQVKGDIAGFAGLIGAPLLALLQQADPYCGSALARSYEGIVDAVLPLLCRSERIVAYFSGDQADWLLWGKLAIALAPAARAVAEHHIVRTVQLVRDEATGQVQVVRRVRGGPEHGDHLTPPAQPEYQYAV